jgi:Asparagine synthase
MLENRFYGFCGQIDYKQQQAPHIVCQKKGDRVAFNGANGAIQWVSPYAKATRKTEVGQLFLSGPASEDPLLEEKISQIFSGGDYTMLAPIAETSAGCLIAKDGIYLWAGIASNSTPFFKVEGLQVMWSTNPLDFVRQEEDFNPGPLRESCSGNGRKAFVYQGVQAVSQGDLIRIWPDEGSLTLRQKVFCFDKVAPHARLSSRGPLPLRRFVDVTLQALEEAIRPLVGIGPIGIMLSGGAGSTALAIMMKKLGIEVIAYHLDNPVKEGSEREFAEEVCKILGIPLRIIMIESDANFFSPRVMGDVFVHPYAHPYGPKMPPLARAVEKDRVRWLVDGGGDDAAYGLREAMEYSVYSIITTGSIPWREKVRILQALCSTRWSLWELARSAWSGKFLIGRERLGDHRADFLTDVLEIRSSPSPVSFPEVVTTSIMGDHGIQLYSPYLGRSLQSVSQALPDLFRFMPVASLAKFYPNLPVTSYIPKLGALVDKPVLRLAASEMAPSLQQALWRNWHPYTDASIQQMCVDNPKIVYDIIRHSSLARTGIVDLDKLKRGLANPEWTRAQYIPLVATCLLVDFMQQEAVTKQLRRGGPEWR